jgi:DNA-directed RNA polymerase specialized sigma24 family protein
MDRPALSEALARSASSDEELVALAKEGAAGALGALMLRFLDLITRQVEDTAAGLGLQEADRDDARQHALLEVLPRAVAGYDGHTDGTAGGGFPAYLAGATRNGVRNFARDRGRTRGECPGDWAALVAALESRWPCCPEAERYRDDDPARLAVEWERTDLLGRVLEQLDATQRLVCAGLSEGLSLGAISAELGEGRAKGKSRWRRLRPRLRRRLAALRP